MSAMLTLFTGLVCGAVFGALFVILWEDAK